MRKWLVPIAAAALGATFAGQASIGADCGKVTACDVAPTPLAGTDQFYMARSNHSYRTTLGAIGNFFLGLVSLPAPPGIPLSTYTSGSAAFTTGSITAGGNTLTLDGDIDFPPSCTATTVNTCGILIGQAGATYATGAPTNPSVAALCNAQALTGDTTNGSPLIRNTAAQQGLNVGDNITGTGIPASTTVTAFNATGHIIRLSANATATNTGVSLSVVDPCTTSYYFRIGTFDANGGVGAAGPVVSTAVGPNHINPWNEVCPLWGAPSGGPTPAGYALWYSRDNQAWHFLGTSPVLSSGQCDIGPHTSMQWAGTGTIRPWWIPDTPPDANLNDWLVTTLASGGGTSTYTMAAPAQNTVSHQRVQHDDTVGYLAWRDALNANNMTTHPTQGYIPPGGYRVRAGATITNNIPIRAEGGAWILPQGPAVGAVLFFSGGGTDASPSATNNFTEANACLPLSSVAGRSIGEYLIIKQDSPGGPSGASAYGHVSPIAALSCDGVTTGVRLTDAAGITFTDGPHTEIATLTGTPAPGDTVNLAVAGDTSCTATYTVLGGDTLATTARGLALAWDALCAGAATATTTGGVVTLSVPSYYSTMNFSRTVVTGGDLAITLALGNGYTIQNLPNMRLGTGVIGLSMDGRDSMGSPAGVLIGVEVVGTANSTYQNLTFYHFNGNGVGFFGSTNYANFYTSIYTFDASGAVPNVTSFDAFELTYDTKSHVTDIDSHGSQSFDIQFAAVTGLDVKGVRSAEARFGRGVKIAGSLASQYMNINVTNASENNIVVCCGSYRNSFVNLSAYNSIGVTADGLAFFDAWDTDNTLTNIKAVGNRYDLTMGPSDLRNSLVNVDVGFGSGFSSVYAATSSIFRAINGCEIAVNTSPTPATSSALTCILQAADLFNKNVVSTSQLDVTNSTTYVDIPGMVVRLAASTVYDCQAVLSVGSGAAGGIKVKLVRTGGLTAATASIIAKGWNSTPALVANGTTTAISADLLNTADVYNNALIQWTIAVSAGGTLTMQAAQAVADATATHVFPNSSMTCWRTN